MKWSIKPCIVRNKKNIKSLRQEIVDLIMKNSNVRQYPITCDNLIIADAYTKVKHRVPKLLLECPMRQLHNELIASPYDGGLVGSKHAITNDVIISDTMLYKMMCGCAICNTSKYMQKYLNTCQREQLKIMKDKADNSRGKEKDELTQAYKSYADYVFP